MEEGCRWVVGIHKFDGNFSNWKKLDEKCKVKFIQNFLKIFFTYFPRTYFEFWENLLKILINYLEIEFVKI